MTRYMYIVASLPQDHVDVGTTSRQSHLHGVAFPINEDALSALKQLHNKELEYVRLVSTACNMYVYMYVHMYS